MTKTISTLTAAAVFAMCATVFAQAPAPEQAPAQMPAASQEMRTPAPAQAPAQAPSAGEEKKSGKAAKGNQGKGKAKGHAKKTGKHGHSKEKENAQANQ